MASITIRNLDDDVKTRLRVRASANGRSMEEEARLILAEAVDREPALREGLGDGDPRTFRALRRRRTGVAAARTDAGSSALRVRQRQW